MSGTEPWLPGFVTGSLALLAAILGGFVNGWLQSRRDKRAYMTNSISPGAPTVQQVWERQDRQERALGAALMLLAQIAEQHENPSKLVLSKTAIKTLRDTGFMPPELEDILPGVE